MTPGNAESSVVPCTCGMAPESGLPHALHCAWHPSRKPDTAAQTLPAGWELIDDAPFMPEFPECGSCYGRKTLLSGDGTVPYGYCPACEAYTTWPLVNRNREGSPDGT